jgi:hypothetical protein
VSFPVSINIHQTENYMHHRRAHGAPALKPAVVAITAFYHSHHAGMVMEQAVLILIFLFVTLRAILQSRRRLNCRPGFIACSDLV